MRFADIPGHEGVKRAMLSMADSGRVPHAMMLYENEGCGAFPLALAFLQYLACPNRHDGDSCGSCPSCNRMSKLIHPDLHFVFPTNTGRLSGSLEAKNVVSEVYEAPFRELALANPYFLEDDLSAAIGVEAKACDINVEEARRLVSKLSMGSFEGGWSSVIFLQPEKINIQAANKLLKTIEEPPEKTILIFITHKPDKVLPTIASRCQAMRVSPMDRTEVERALAACGKTGAAAAVQAAICGGSPGRALRELGDSEDRSLFRELFSRLMEALLSKDLAGCLDFVEALAELGSKEKQKAFMAYMSECLRNVFVLQQTLPQLTYCSDEDREYYLSLASRCPRNFCRRSQELLDKTVAMLERNVNQKILFCDLVDRLFLSI